MLASIQLLPPRLGAFALVVVLTSLAPVIARDFPHSAQVVKLENLNHDIKRITFKPKSEGFDFTVGQYVHVKAPESYIEQFNARYKTDHGEISRPYSFASNPSNQATFSLIIKRYGPPRPKKGEPPPEKEIPPGVMSTFIHKHLKVGDVLSISEPRGELYLKTDSKRPIVIIAGGVGVSPFVGLLNYFFEQKINEERKIYFFFGVNTIRDLVLHEQFTEWAKKHKNFYYVPAVARVADNETWEGEKGYGNQVFERYFKESIDADAYIAGSPTMRKFTTQSLVKKGVTRDRVRWDRIRVGEN